MTKNRSMRIAVLVLALALLTSCFVGSTFAKYTSSASGSDSATVAKWHVTVNGNHISVKEDPSITFDLFNTIYDTDGTTEEEDVAENMIAPGTSGYFALAIANLSDVNAKYSITFAETANTLNVPIEYATSNGVDASWGEITALNVSEQDIDMTNGEASVKVYWRWVYDGDHTGIGIDAQNTTQVSVSATIDVTQVD